MEQTEHPQHQDEDQQVNRFNYPVIQYKVIDGDTVRCILDRGFDATKRIDVRLHMLNTPETRTRNKLEKKAGLACKSIVKSWCVLLEGHLQAESHKWGKFARRTLGDIYGFDTPHRLSDFLLTHKLAEPYDGGKRKPFSDDFCERIIEFHKSGKYVEFLPSKPLEPAVLRASD